MTILNDPQLVVVAIMFFVEYLLVLMAIMTDLWSGVRKAKERGEARTSYGFRKTVDKLSKYYNFMFAFSIMDLMQMIAVWYLEEYYQWAIPLLPIVTLLGALALCAIEIKSIFEKAEDKDRKDLSAVAQLAKELARHKNEPAEIAKAVAQYLGK